MTSLCDLPPFAPGEEVVRDLVQAAVFAPSADNQHHFFVVRDPRGLTVHADRSFVECTVPHRRLLILVSFGAVVENLRLRLTEHGFSFRPRWFPDDSDRSVVLRLAWDDMDRVDAPDPLASAIAARHTNRRFYKGPVLSTPERAAIDGAVDGDSVRLAWFTGTERKPLLRLMRMAETARFASRSLHAELFGSIDFGAGWNDSVPERLAPGSLGVERPLRPAFKAFRHWPLMRLANRLGAHDTFGLRAGDLPARTAPHLGVITSTLAPDDAALCAGATFQRIWLAAERLGLALQPMVAASILSIHRDSIDGLPTSAYDKIRRGWAPLVGSATPIIVFRLGRALRPAVRSGRRPVDNYLR